MRFLFQATSNLTKEWFSSKKSLKEDDPYFKIPPHGMTSETVFGGKVVRLNVALMNGKKIGLPDNLQAPPQLGLTDFQKKSGARDELIALSLYVFQETIARLANFFKKTKISIIYIPSPVSSYKIVSSHVISRGYMQDSFVAETGIVEEIHIKLCNTIKRFAELNNFSFVNTTKSLRHL